MNPLICGFAKVRNELVREGNLYRLLDTLRQCCDVAVVCDDASTDGTREVLQRDIPSENLLLVPPDEQDFRHELRWKQRMLERVHQIHPQWVFWVDADEAVDDPKGLRVFAEEKVRAPEVAWKFHYTQFWRNESWARTDDNFDSAYFVKLWKWSPGLAFEVYEGTHHSQYPQPLPQDLIGIAPFEILHYGNSGKNLIWKCIQYWGGLGGVDRHLHFEQATYRRVAEGPQPVPFTPHEISRIRAMRDLRGLREAFTVVIPTYNRAHTLPRALGSLLAQTYERWIAVVIDDGSTDDTPQLMWKWQDMDPRIFYVRFNENRGGVAANEVGMALACEWAEWWTRLGSDDWFFSNKLEHDAAALLKHHAVYGPFVVARDSKFEEMCNQPLPPDYVRWLLNQGQFHVGWANCAVRTDVLRKIRNRYGNFCDPRLRNMEDFLVNARIAREVPWVWRGTSEWRLVINPFIGEAQGNEPDAVWTSAEGGASADSRQTGEDHYLTQAIIREESPGGV